MKKIVKILIMAEEAKLWLGVICFTILTGISILTAEDERVRLHQFGEIIFSIFGTVCIALISGEILARYSDRLKQ